MKRGFLAGLIAGLILATVGVAVAASSSYWTRNGITCQPMKGGVACVRSDGNGYGVGITHDFALILNLDTGRRIVRYQP